MYKKILWISLLICFLMTLGCVGLFDVANCDTTPTKSSNPKCLGVLYPSNAMDPCEPVADNWVEVNQLIIQGGITLDYLVNTKKGDKRTHIIGVFAPGQRLPALIFYLEDGQICALRFQAPKQYVWEPNMTPQRYDAIKELFMLFPPQYIPVVEPFKQRC